MFVADLQMSRFWRNFVIISKTEIADLFLLKKSSLPILHGWRVINLLSVVIICFLLFQCYCCVWRCYHYFSVVCVDVIVLSVSPKMPIYTSPHLGSHPLCEFVPVDKLTTT